MTPIRTTVPQVPSFFARLSSLLAATDQAVAWWGDHRAWPANEPARVKAKRA